jgi:hypothetical protein
MPRAKPPEDIRDRREEGKQPRHREVAATHAQATISKSWKIMAGAVTLLATSLGIATGYLSLLPRVSVSQNQPLDPANLFSAPFIVSNDGPLGINDVQILCDLQKVKTGTGGIENIAITSPGLHVDGMEPGERATFPCGPPIKISPDSADVIFVVEFRADFVPWRTKRYFRFVTMNGSGGQLFWYPQAYDRVNH